MRKVKKAKMVAGLLCLAMILGACGTGASGQQETTTAKQPETTEAEQSGLYKPGTYTASAQGKNGTVTLSVTFSGEAIESIEIGEHQETAGISDGAFEEIPAAIVQNQSLGIDVVAGATITSNAILEAVANCVTQAGGDVEALKAAGAESTGVDKNVLQDSETDVLVIGGGAAGLAAALSAAENGARVILIEKLPSVGGTTILSGGLFNAVDPVGVAKSEMTDAAAAAVEAYLAVEDKNEGHAMLKALVREQWEDYLASGSTEYFDSPEYQALELMAYGSYEGNAELILNFTSKAYDTLIWTQEVGGVQWQEASSARAHDTINTTSVDTVEGLKGACLDRNVEIYTDTRAMELIQEDGVVVGAVATNANGESVTIRANKGVILATGGFSANVEMRMKYSEVYEGLDETYEPYGSAGSTGDGIIMAEAVGANLVDMGFITMKNESITGKSIAHGSKCFTSSIYVNQEGKRFIAEDEKSEIAVIRAVLEQTGGLYYMITDEAEAESRGFTLESLTEMADGGYVYAAETIADLAVSIGIDPAVLEETVAKFNESVDSGEDEFGRTTWVNKIETGPFYAVPFRPYVHSTLGGVQINTDAQVIDVDGNVIAGLYAAGEVTGDIQGKERKGGNTIPEALTYGRIAGANAAAN